MKKIVVLTVLALASQAVAIFAGEPESKQVVAPPPPPPPEFFRPNEFDIGAFWTYAGVRFQGTGASIRGGGGSRTVTFFDGETEHVSRAFGGGSVAAGVITS